MFKHVTSAKYETLRGQILSVLFIYLFIYVWSLAVTSVSRCSTKSENNYRTKSKREKQCTQQFSVDLPCGQNMNSMVIQ